jgi:hypothetical protein
MYALTVALHLHRDEKGQSGDSVIVTTSTGVKEADGSAADMWVVITVVCVLVSLELGHHMTMLCTVWFYYRSSSPGARNGGLGVRQAVNMRTSLQRAVQAAVQAMAVQRAGSLCLGVLLRDSKSNALYAITFSCVYM